jgi:hypothetical protein
MTRHPIIHIIVAIIFFGSDSAHLTALKGTFIHGFTLTLKNFAEVSVVTHGAISGRRRLIRIYADALAYNS